MKRRGGAEARRHGDACEARAASPPPVMSSPLHIPFSAIAGLEEAKRALLLLAVDEGLKGVLIAAGQGAGKSVLLNSLPSIWPCVHTPRASRGQSPDHNENRSHTPFVKVPLNVTEDRLLGGVDFERTIMDGKPAFDRGLLASADGGLLVVDDINLMDDRIISYIAGAVDSNIARTEREGVSATSAARFALVGAYAPEEGDVSLSLRERIALIVEVAANHSVDEIAEASQQVLEFEKDPHGFVRDHASETTAVRGSVEEARAQLSKVRVTREDRLRLSQAALALGVEGNRADLFAVRAARANAALGGREQLGEDDLILAIRFVLLPRATRVPELNRNPDATMDNEPEKIDGRREEARSESRDEYSESRFDTEDLIIAAIESPAPDIVISRSRHVGRLARSGKRAQAKDARRGRYSRATSQRGSGRKVAVDATLRAAATSSKTPSSFKKNRMAEAATEKTAALKVRPDDLRFKLLKRRSGILFIFAVDASGSMRVNRMAQAKGAMTKLLGTAYLHRDKVALISFRRTKADVLLGPTRSVELARRSVDALAAGGATPLAAGLLRAIELARGARLREAQQVVLLIFTDGRANVGLENEGANRMGADAIRGELSGLGAALRREEIKPVIIDTRLKFASNGEGQVLADMLGASYFYLPRADAGAVYNAVSQEASALRRESFSHSKR